MKTGRRRTIPCPTCRKVLSYRDPSEHKYFPFCSERCQMVDLGRWLTGEYRIEEEESRGPDEKKNP